MFHRNKETQRRLKKLYDGPGRKYCTGVYWDEKKKRYCRYYLGKKEVLKKCNRKIRRISKEQLKHERYEDVIGQHNSSRKLTEYKWDIC